MRLSNLAVSTAILLVSNASFAEIDKQACEQVFRSTANVVDCELRFLTNAQERENLVKSTYGIVRDISCGTHLNIPKNNVVNALLGAGEMTLSPHTLGCHIQTNGDPFNVGLTLAPRIQFGNEGASDVRLNVQQVTGVPTFIENFIVRYGNRPELQEQAKKALNQFLNQF